RCSVKKAATPTATASLTRAPSGKPRWRTAANMCRTAAGRGSTSPLWGDAKGRDSMTKAVEQQNVSRVYGDVHAVDGVSLEVKDGQFFSMLGPSGSGKTTCLRLIAGFDQLSGGAIRIFGQDASALPPWQRDVNTVFQDYALFPHMSILDNVAYGLMVKGMNKKQRHARAREALEKVALGFVHTRKPSQLSGGQRQRVAIARALV